MPTRIRSLAALGAPLWPYEACCREDHYLRRRRERGFDERRLLPPNWASPWRPGNSADDWIVECRDAGEVWEVVVRIEEETPVLKTVRVRTHR